MSLLNEPEKAQCDLFATAATKVTASITCKR